MLLLQATRAWDPAAPVGSAGPLRGGGLPACSLLGLIFLRCGLITPFASYCTLCTENVSWAQCSVSFKLESHASKGRCVIRPTPEGGFRGVLGGVPPKMSLIAPPQFPPKLLAIRKGRRGRGGGPDPCRMIPKVQNKKRQLFCPLELCELSYFCYALRLSLMLGLGSDSS